MATAASLRIPELLLEVASNLSDIADISRLSRCDRMSRELTMPLLFRDLCIPIQKATPVAYVLRKYPHYARRCKSFILDGSSEEDTSGGTLGTYPSLFEHLAVVLLTLADNARVRLVWWFRFGRPGSGLPVPVPTYIWEALGKLSGSLEELRIVISGRDSDGKNLHSIWAPEYSQLRTLDVWLEDAHGWDCSPLQAMLNNLKKLENLYLRLPILGRAFGVDLSSYHPRLRTFTFSTEALDGQALSFLHRHPTIECLCIDTAGGYTVNDRDLPHLKALCIEGKAIKDTPGLLSPSSRRPITHLRANIVGGYDIIPSLHQLVENAHSTLRHLEIFAGWHRSIGVQCNTLLKVVRQLEELRIVWDSNELLPLCDEDLISLLSSLVNSTNISRLRLTALDGEPLSEYFLSDVGAVPSSLEYLSWEVQRKLVTYRLESREGKIVAVPAELPYSGKTILDFDDSLGPVYGELEW